MKKIIIANWKMNNNLVDTKEFFEHFIIKYNKNINFFIAPAYPFLHYSYNMCKNTDIKITSQNVHYSKTGSFTGEVSVDMLKSINIKTVIIGHYERKLYFHENNKILLKKVNISLKNNLKVILCIGEKNNIIYEQIKQQLDDILIPNLEYNTNNNSVYLAYEPIWAIGSNKQINIKIIKKMYEYIKNYLINYINYDIPLIYGGNVNKENINNIINIFDGVMIGRESIKSKNLLNLTKKI